MIIAAAARPDPAGVVVVGGGLAGLAAACHLARAGVGVTLFERSAALGGRAATDDRGGFHFNRGLHALYTGGAASATLRELGIAYGHGIPPGTFALDGARLVPVPASPLALLRGDLLGWRDKLALARLFATLPRLDPRALARTSARDWIDAATPRPAVRRLLASIARPFVYSAALNLVSADVLVAKFQAVLAHPVHYLDGGWQTLADALVPATMRAGARIVAGTAIEAVVIADGRAAGVRAGDGATVPAAAVIVATALREAARLLPAGAAPALHRAVAAATPARVACLDVALRRLPDARHTVVQDLDGPRFLSAQSACARVAPAGAALTASAPLTAAPARPATPAPGAPGLVGGPWELVTLQAAGESPEDTAGAGITITFRADGRAAGSGGCNGFGAAYTSDAGGGLRLADLAATLIGCAPPVAAREARYFATLLEARRYATDGATLRLGFDAPGRQLVFRRAAPNGGSPPGLPNTGAGGRAGGAGDGGMAPARPDTSLVIGLLAIAASLALAVAERRWPRASGRLIQRR